MKRRKMVHAPDETRARILATSLELFSKAGYEAASVADICTAAGVSKGAFYHHFPSKHAVFMRLLEDWLDTLLPEIESLLQRSKDIPTGLVEMGALVPGIFSQAENRLPMFLEFWTQASRDPLVWQATVAPYRQFLDLFSGYIRRGVEEGSLAVRDPDAASRLFLAVILGMILQGMMDPQSADWSQTTRESIRILVDGLQRRPE
jgi:AcrR family transcriptional regulator